MELGTQIIEHWGALMSSPSFHNLCFFWPLSWDMRSQVDDPTMSVSKYPNIFMAFFQAITSIAHLMVDSVKLITLFRCWQLNPKENFRFLFPEPSKQYQLSKHIQQIQQKIQSAKETFNNCFQRSAAKLVFHAWQI